VNAVTRQVAPPPYDLGEPRKESDMTYMFLRFLWTTLRPRALALVRVRSLGEAELSTSPHHLVFIGL
jgi:hypothetical protein